MTAWNVVRFRVKPGRDEDFLNAHRNVERAFAGMRRFSLVKTGDSSYCVIGEWQSFRHLADARPGMIGILDSFRDCLLDLGNGLGLTDPVSGETLLEIVPKTRKRAAKKSAAKSKAKKKTPKKASVRKDAGKRKRR